MENKKIEMENLLNRNKELKPIIFVGFKTEEELDNYRKKIHSERVEYYNNLKKIESLEWELMTPEERERRLEVTKKVRAKTSGNQSQ